DQVIGINRNSRSQSPKYAIDKLKRFFFEDSHRNTSKNEIEINDKEINKPDLNTNEIVSVPPKLRSEGLRGVLGELAYDLADGTEASIEFIASYIKLRIASSIPRGYFTMPYGAFTTEIRINAIYTLYSGGGKGLAEKQSNALFKIANELLGNDQISEHSGLPLHSRVHTGGLSTGEGIAYELRDEAVTEKGEVQLGIEDKRLCVIESEFVNLLSMCHRSGSILSGTIRKLFDGDSIEPMTKTSRTCCKDPHVHIGAHITPDELLAKLDSVSISNGFANRFPIFSGIQPVYQPIPKVIDNNLLIEHGKKINSILAWCHKDRKAVTMSECYEQLWNDKYSDLKQIGARGSIEQSLMSRAPHYASMYAMLFAAMDKTTIVTSQHLISALAWIDYWHESVRYIFNTEAAAYKAEQQNLKAIEVLNTIKDLISDNNGQPITRTPLKQALGKKYTSKQLTEILKFLQELPKAPIEVTKHQHNKQVISLT
ncbi:DUF3987 domain-containing protein, partial [Vibrio splendidus]|uniref:DUF3987 domain-containing protein n=2 Tax=Vibrio splendidus TaxID=29497 RepID=UPI00352D1B19